MPAISVIMPVYQVKNSLRGSVKSVLDQSLADLELILVDDGSSDGSAAVCDALAGEDGRVRVIHKKNAGVSAARNDGLDLASGEYIAFCDADDTLPSNALQSLYGALVSSGADTAGGGHVNVWPDGREQPEAGALPAGTYGAKQLREQLILPLFSQRLDFGKGVVNGFIWRFLFRRDVIERNHVRFDGPYLEDELFLLEYLLGAEKLVMIDQPVYRYLQNPASVTKNYLSGYLDVFRRVMARKRELAERYGLGEQAPAWETNSNWAGLLIAVGNEYAPGSPKSFGEKSASVKNLCREPDMAAAMKALQPKGLAGNKQMVADLLLGRHFFLLTLLYTVKNRGR